MDNTDCWITEFDYKALTPTSSSAGFTSPGPSSGYCSSEEGQASYSVQGHGQVKVIGTVEPKAPAASRASSESTWRSSDAFYGAHALDPYLGEVGGALGSIEESAANDLRSSSSLNFDYLMDTWNPLGETPMMSDYGDLLADFDMIDVNQSSALLSMPQQVNNPRVATAAAKGNPVPTKGWQKRAASPVDEAPGLAKKPSNPTLASSAVSAESRNRLKTVFNFQQQVAGLTDMVVGDEEEYVLQFVTTPKHNNGVMHRVSSTPAAVSTSRPSQAPNSGVPPPPQTSGSALLGGVFGVPSSLKHCETKVLTRIRSGAVATSCGTLLRHSVSIPTNVRSAAAVNKDSTASVRAGGSRSHTSGVARGDMRGGRASNASLLALDDHRYTLKSIPNPPAQSKSGRGRKGSAQSAPSASSSSAVPYSGKMSILEAFLRSTRPLDPNKGSNAALAAEGLAHLRIEADGDDDDRRSGTILKKLLTGEIDQSEVHRCEERVIQERTSSSSTTSTAIGGPQTIGDGDGFALSVELLLEDADTTALLCEDIGAGGGLWMNAENEDESLSSELDEILREQTRQDDLWLRHYINCL